MNRGARARLVIGAAGLVASGLPVHDHSIGPIETAVFRSVNGLPDRLYRPVWVVMQLGNAFAPQVAAVVLAASGRPREAVRVSASGGATWLLAKLVKRVYRRPRPAVLLADARCRGPQESGLGYVSGHAGVSTCVAAVLAPIVRRHHWLVCATPLAVGLCRMYVGAHLPLDVLGGAALGLATDALVERLVVG